MELYLTIPLSQTIAELKEVASTPEAVVVNGGDKVYPIDVRILQSFLELHSQHFLVIDFITRNKFLYVRRNIMSVISMYIVFVRSVRQAHVSLLDNIYF